MPVRPPNFPPEFPPPWRPTPGSPTRPGAPPDPGTPWRPMVPGVPAVPDEPPWRPMLPPTPSVFPDPRSPSHLDDVYERLFDQRIVVIDGPLAADVATRAAAQVMLLDANGDSPIDVYLSCSDGELDAALGLADTFDLVGVELRATARGSVGGPALAAYVSAGRRLAHLHARFLMREPTVEMSGRAVDLVAQVEAHEHQLQGLYRRIGGRTGKSPDRVAKDMREGKTLTADEALRYGLVHEIVGARRPRPL